MVLMLLQKAWQERETNMIPKLIVERLGQLDSEAAFFSSSSKSERLTFDPLKSSRIRSNCLSIAEINSENFLRSDSRALSDIYISVHVNFLFFLDCFFMFNNIMEGYFFVKENLPQKSGLRDLLMSYR